VEVCNTIVRGRDAAITLPPSGLGEDDEWRKRITAILLAGMDSVLIDNVESAVGNKSLNGLLTSDVWTDRILGRSETVSLPARVTWAATGNGLVVRGDQVRRTVMLCIDPGVERPEQRRFKRDLAIWVPANRQRLLSAAMTILRAYRRAGCPGQDDVLLGRFEPWSRTVCGPIRWLGMPDPTASQVELVAEDPEMERLADVHSVLSEWFGEQPFSVADVGKVLSDDFADVGKAPGLKDALREALAVVAGGSGPGGISTKRLGWYLRHFAGRVIAGRKLVRLDQFHKPHYLVAAAAEG